MCTRSGLGQIFFDFFILGKRLCDKITSCDKRACPFWLFLSHFLVYLSVFVDKMIPSLLVPCLQNPFPQEVPL
jgi:hypothetical protein